MGKILKMYVDIKLNKSKSNFLTFYQKVWNKWLQQWILHYYSFKTFVKKN